MKKLIFGICIIVVAALAAVYYWPTPTVPQDSKESVSVPSSPAVIPPVSPTPIPVVLGTSVTIEMSDEGFLPKEITIKPKTTVIFKAIGANTDGYWPASAIHPTHTIYPGSDIKKCGTSEEKSIFDACRGFVKGEAWSFEFNQKGIWRYHDHNHSSLFGVITVE